MPKSMEDVIKELQEQDESLKVMFYCTCCHTAKHGQEKFIQALKNAIKNKELDKEMGELGYYYKEKNG